MLLLRPECEDYAKCILHSVEGCVSLIVICTKQAICGTRSPGLPLTISIMAHFGLALLWICGAEGSVDKSLD
jgi:hypothetical protein